MTLSRLRRGLPEEELLDLGEKATILAGKWLMAFPDEDSEVFLVASFIAGKMIAVSCKPDSEQLRVAAAVAALAVAAIRDEDL